MEPLLGVIVGICLSAACGFRVFVPLLVMNLAARAGHLQLAPGFEWINSWAALIVFGAATVTEIAAYFFPIVDHALDVVTTPAAVVAGTVITASVIGDLSPVLRWSLAAIAGGGTAGVIQAMTVAARLFSTSHSAGIGNPVVAGTEAAGAATMSLLSILAPVVGLALLAVLVLPAILLVRRSLRRARRTPAAVR